MPSTLSIFTPTPEVTFDGGVPEGLTGMLLSVLVEDNAVGLSRCEVRVDNWGLHQGALGYAWLDRAAIEFGAEVEVSMGPPDERGSVFRGRVTGLEAEYPGTAGPSLVVLAEDRLQDLRMTRRTRTFTDATDADIVEQVARDHGLTPEVDLDGPTHAVVAQVNQSDLAFLRERLLPLGADLWLDGLTVHVTATAGGREPIVLRYSRELLAFRVLADLAHQCTEQRVAGWDVGSKEAVLESSAFSSIEGELGVAVGGGRILADTFGDRVATSVLATAGTASEARALARGLHLDRARRFVTGTGRSDGIVGLRVGRSVELAGLGTMFDGVYRLVRVAHRYDTANGYRTEFDVERPGVGR